MLSIADVFFDGEKGGKKKNMRMRGLITDGGMCACVRASCAYKFTANAVIGKGLAAPVQIPSFADFPQVKISEHILYREHTSAHFNAQLLFI